MSVDFHWRTPAGALEGEFMTMVIGLTGGIACGKSTVSQYLQQKGIPVVDADLVARQVVAPGTVGLQQIKDTFGWQYIMPDGSLNRTLLGKKVFADKNALAQLNAITGPLIAAELKRQLKEAGSLVVLDAALLLEEARYRSLVDVVWVVTVEPEEQLRRLLARNHYSRRQALERIAAQMSNEQRIRYADGVIDNNGTREQTWQQVEQLLSKFTAK